MRHSYGKPYVKSARVDIGTVLMSLRTLPKNVEHVETALRYSRFKFAGRQTVFVSRKYGFTPHIMSDFKRLMKEGKILGDGVNIKTVPNHGTISDYARWCAAAG